MLEIDPEAFKRRSTSTCSGCSTLSRRVASVIERRGYVLIVSSLAAYAAAPGMASYDAAKAGVEIFANALRLEVADLGVAVGSAHLSWIDTPMVQDARRICRRS